MNYILIVCVVLAACIAAAVLTTRGIFRRKTLLPLGKVLVTAGFSAVFFLLVILVYLMNYYHADTKAAAALQSDAMLPLPMKRAGTFLTDPARTGH